MTPRTLYQVHTYMNANKNKIETHNAQGTENNQVPNNAHREFGFSIILSHTSHVFECLWDMPTEKKTRIKDV